MTATTKIGLLIVAVSHGTPCPYDIPPGDYAVVVQADRGRYLAVSNDGVWSGDAAGVVEAIEALPSRGLWEAAGLYLAKARMVGKPLLEPPAKQRELLFRDDQIKQVVEAFEKTISDTRVIIDDPHQGG